MRFAYFIIAHAQPRQLDWLIRAISDPRDLILVHINSRTDAQTAASMRAVTRGLDNVFYMPRRPISWGGWNLAAVDLDAISFALQTERPWDYFINMSGHDYPLRPIEDLRAFLSRKPGANYLEAVPYARSPWHIKRRSQLLYMEIDKRVRRIPLPNPLPRPMPIYKGLKWGQFSRAFCEWLNAESDIVERACRFFRLTRIPDESLFHSLLMASPFRDTLVQDPMRLCDFSGGKANTRVFTTADWPLLSASEAFFARKFDESLDAQILHRLAEKIGAPTPPAAA